MLWAIKHLPLTFYKSKSGFFKDPNTGDIIAEVYYFDSNIIVAGFIKFIIWITMGNDAKYNRNKCIRYGYLY